MCVTSGLENVHADFDWFSSLMLFLSYETDRRKDRRMAGKTRNAAY